MWHYYYVTKYVNHLWFNNFNTRGYFTPRCDVIDKIISVTFNDENFLRSLVLLVDCQVISTKRFLLSAKCIYLVGHKEYLIIILILQNYDLK